MAKKAKKPALPRCLCGHIRTMHYRPPVSACALCDDCPEWRVVLPEPVPATARTSDPDTSHEAAERITPERLTAIQSDVLAFFTRVRRATDEDLETEFMAKYTAYSTIRKRRTELTQLGFLRDSGERRINKHDRNMIVWEIVQ